MELKNTHPKMATWNIPITTTTQPRQTPRNLVQNKKRNELPNRENRKTDTLQKIYGSQKDMIRGKNKTDKNIRGKKKTHHIRNKTTKQKRQQIRNIHQPRT